MSEAAVEECCTLTLTIQNVPVPALSLTFASDWLELLPFNNEIMNSSP